jgi:alanine dehydrogenase
MTLILSNEDAEQLLTMADCIGALDQAYRELAHGQSISAVSSDAYAPVGQTSAIYQLRLAAGVIPSTGIAALRLNSNIIAFENNRQVRLNESSGNRMTDLVLLFSAKSGLPLAIFPDSVVQRMRVGATSALAARHLARTDSKAVALLGAGWQAGAQAMGIAATHKIQTIRCYSPTKDRRDAFCKRMSERIGISITSAMSSEQAVRGADIVLCATNSSKHVFAQDWFEPGMHVGTIRGPELGPEVVSKADVIALHDRGPRDVAVTAQGANMPGAKHGIAGLPAVDKAPTLAELIAGIAPGRTSAEQKSCFLNLRGIGLQFAAVGGILYRKALAAGRGHEIPTDWFTQEPLAF